MPASPIVFISYSHKDTLWKDRLVVFLQSLGAEVEVWADDRIGAGKEWRVEIETAMDGATVAVLLVTANFLTSNFILTEEVPRLLKRREKGMLEIVPIVVLPCPWRRIVWLSALQCRPTDGRVLTLRKDRTPTTDPEIDLDLNEIAGEIADLANRPAARPPVDPVTLAGKAAGGVPVAEASPPTAVAEAAQQASAIVRQVTRSAADSDAGAVLAGFEDAFRATSEAIEAITGFKALHDELHNFELDTFAGIQTDYGRVGSEAEARERLGEYAAALQDTIHQIRAIAAHLPALPGGGGWMDKLDRAHALLVEAIATQSPARAATAVALLNGVLDAQPELLNEQIVARSQALDFAPVQKALGVAQSLLTAELPSTAEQREKVQAQIASLSRLDREFMSLVNEHSTWQHVERELRTIETSIAGSFEQLEALWPILHDLALPLFADRSKPRDADLHDACTELGKAIETPNAPKAVDVRKCFRRFRRLCATRFHQIDEELRDACGRLGRVGESLQLLLRMLDTTQP